MQVPFGDGFLGGGKVVLTRFPRARFHTEKETDGEVGEEAAFVSPQERLFALNAEPGEGTGEAGDATLLLISNRSWQISKGPSVRLIGKEV